MKEIRRKAKQKHYAKVSADPDLLAERLASTAKWRDANRERMAAQYRAWFDDNVERARQKTRRRRARLLAAFVEDVDLAVLLERDAGICGICTEPIDLALRWPDRGSLTLDHVIPLSRGGTHEYANTQIAHAVCNSRKNDRPALQ